MSANSDFYKDNDYEFDFVVHKKKTADGTPEPATGLTGLFAWVSATDGGDEINAALKVAAVARSGEPESYYGTIPGALITTWMFGVPSYDGKQVFLRFRGTSQNINVSLPRKAFAVRRAG